MYEGLVAIIASGVGFFGDPLFERLINLEPKSIAKKMRRRYSILIFLFGMVDILSGMENFDYLFLFLIDMISWTQTHMVFLIIAISVFALIPPLTRLFELRGDKNCATLKSVWGNLGFNLVGALAASVSLLTASLIIKDYWGIYRLPLGSAIGIVLSVCIWIAFTYQKIEQDNPETNDILKKSDAFDPSLKWKNQILNVIHLINVYFFSIMSGVLLFAYSHYCYSHGYKLPFSWEIFILLSVILVFFYMCAFNNKEHIYLVFLETVPILLCLFALWFNWFEYTGYGVILFFAFHFIIYLIFVLRREKNMKLFNYIIPIVAFLLMIVIFFTSQSIERIPVKQAQNYLSLIHMESHIAQIEAMRFFDQAKQEIDSAIFIDYLNENFATELEQIGCYPATIESLKEAHANS